MCQTRNTLRLARPITRPFVQPTSAVRSVRKLQPFQQPLGPSGPARGPVHLVLHTRAPKGRADEARRALHRSGRPNLLGPQPSGARPVTSDSDPAGRCRAGEAHLCQRRGLRFQRRRAGSREAGARAHRGPGVHAGLGLHGSVGQRLRLRPQRLSVRRRRSWGEKREATEDTAGDRTAKRAPAAGGPVARRARVLLGNVVLPEFRPSVSRATT